jgi:hypothetical protein
MSLDIRPDEIRRRMKTRKEIVNIVESVITQMITESKKVAIPESFHIRNPIPGSK